MLCTGTLISPTVVLTAKHCVVDREDPTNGMSRKFYADEATVFFKIGHDSKKAEGRGVVFSARASTVAELGLGGGVDLGADVGVYILDAPVVGVTPVTVSEKPLTDAEKGQSFVAVGYGDRDRQGSFGIRMSGNITLSLLTGRPYQQLYGTFEAFEAAWANEIGKEVLGDDLENLKKAWNAPLLDQYEAYFMPKDGDVQGCYGDSGRPLLRMVDGKLTTFGVMSWMPMRSVADS